jgi:hypothetical protein
MLLDAGMSTTVRDADGNCAFDLARENGTAATLGPQIMARLKPPFTSACTGIIGAHTPAVRHGAMPSETTEPDAASTSPPSAVVASNSSEKQLRHRPLPGITTCTAGINAEVEVEQLRAVTRQLRNSVAELEKQNRSLNLQLTAARAEVAQLEPVTEAIDTIVAWSKRRA